MRGYWDLKIKIKVSLILRVQRCEFEQELSTSGHGRGDVKDKIV